MPGEQLQLMRKIALDFMGKMTRSVLSIARTFRDDNFKVLIQQKIGTDPMYAFPAQALNRFLKVVTDSMVT